MAAPNMGINCLTITGNTGTLSCNYTPGNFAGFLLVPKDTVWTPTQVSTLSTVISAAIANNNPNLRYFPFNIATSIENKSEAVVETTTAYGDRRFIRNGKYGWAFEYEEGGLDLHAQLSTFTNQQNRFDVFLIDKGLNGLVGTASGAANMRGFALSTMIAHNVETANGTDPAKFRFEIGLKDEIEFNQRFRVVKFDSAVTNVMDFEGLLPTQLSVQTDLVFSTKTVIVKAMYGNTGNLGLTYPTELATLAVWNIVRDSTGISYPASTVTVNAITGIVTVISSTLLGAAAESYTLKLGTVSALTSAAILRTANCETTTIAT